MRYHIAKNGLPAVCNAKEGNCPLGGTTEHFSNLDEAHTKAQANLRDTYTMLSSFENAEGVYVRDNCKIKPTILNTTGVDDEGIYEAQAITMSINGEDYTIITKEYNDNHERPVYIGRADGKIGKMADDLFKPQTTNEITVNDKLEPSSPVHIQLTTPPLTGSSLIETIGYQVENSVNQEADNEGDEYKISEGHINEFYF